MVNHFPLSMPLSLSPKLLGLSGLFCGLGPVAKVAAKLFGQAAMSVFERQHILVSIHS